MFVTGAALVPCMRKNQARPYLPVQAARKRQHARLTRPSLPVRHSDFVHLSLDLIWDTKVAEIANDHLAIRAHRVTAGLMRDTDSR
jgi:hypothetical protein